MRMRRVAGCWRVVEPVGYYAVECRDSYPFQDQRSFLELRPVVVMVLAWAKPPHLQRAKVFPDDSNFDRAPSYPFPHRWLHAVVV